MIMERKFYGRYGIYAPLLLVITLIATTLRTVGVFLGVNEYGFFEVSILSDVSAWIVVGGVLLALTYPLTHKRIYPIFRDDRTPLTYLPAAILGLCLIFFGAEVTPDALSLLAMQHISPLTVSATLLLVLSACGVLYAASVCLIESSLSDRRAGLGMLTVLLYGIYAAFLYYDTTLPLNAPIKIADQMTYLAFALFLLYEVRISLGREQQGLYSAFGFIAGMMASYSAVPSILLYIIKGRVLSFSLAETILTLGTLLFIIGRMLVRDSSPEDRPIPLMGEIIRVAEARDLSREALNQSALAGGANTNAEYGDTPVADAEPSSEHNADTEDTTEDAQLSIDFTSEAADTSATALYDNTDPIPSVNPTEDTPYEENTRH